MVWPTREELTLDLPLEPYEWWSRRERTEYPQAISERPQPRVSSCVDALLVPVTDVKDGGSLLEEGLDWFGAQQTSRRGNIGYATIFEPLQYTAVIITCTE